MCYKWKLYPIILNPCDLERIMKEAVSSCASFCYYDMGTGGHSEYRTGNGNFNLERCHQH
jgi:hypothetical protein